MESKDRKFSNFIGDLKASNIASNISSLDFYSQQICLLLEMIKTNNNSIMNYPGTDTRTTSKNI